MLVGVLCCHCPALLGYEQEYGPCGTVSPICFWLMTFEMRRIASQTDHSRARADRTNIYVFCTFFSDSLKPSYRLSKNVFKGKFSQF